MLYMFTAISSLKKLLDIDNKIQITEDFENSNTVFNDDLDLQEEIEFIDEPETLDVKIETKINQIKFNISQNCKEITILDPRNKKIEFAMNNQRLETKTYLADKYETVQKSESKPKPISITQMDNKEGKENVLLAAMYTPTQDPGINEEVQLYLALPKILSAQCPLKCNRLFSDAGNLMTVKHGCLNVDLFERMLFLKRNVNYVRAMFPQD
ncbi:8717_t:CDS:2 [Scutellospora calospora]|uniref:8717_t:CDS:1 n=1 Tax=Scutellospora calospora TaxID=85575 RepID=A0ACA9LH73_9GLOM|nr:8717_t:CDS:2 [Scutellospora calospora]